MVSCWSSSGLLYGEIPTKHRVQRINKCSGQVAMPRCLPLVGKFDTVSYNRLRACCITLHHMQSSGARPQEWIWGCLGVLCWFMTPSQLPLMGMSHVRVLPGLLNLTAGQICVRQDGCSLPMTRGHDTSTKLFTSPLAVGSLCKPGLSRWAYGLWLPIPWTQPQLIFRAASGFGSLVNALFSLSLVYFSLDLR